MDLQKHIWMFWLWTSFSPGHSRIFVEPGTGVRGSGAKDTAFRKQEHYRARALAFCW